MNTPPPLPAQYSAEAAGTPDRIAAGVRAGILSAEQAQALYALNLGNPASTNPTSTSVSGAQVAGTNMGYRQFSNVQAGDEGFALFRGFRDLFLALGVILLGSGLFATFSALLGLDLDFAVSWSDVAMLAILAGLAWGIAEWVTGRLRMPMASLVAACGFCFGVGGALVTALSALDIMDTFEGGGFLPIFASLAALVFYWRFRLPFALGLAGAGLAYFMYTLLLGLFGDHQLGFQVYGFIIGAFLFVMAMYYELKDPARQTRFSENAFWLHLIAAPLLIFAITGNVSAFAIDSTGTAIQVALIVVVLGLIALLIDRRAFIVSALLYLGGAVAYAISQSGLESEAQLAITTLVLGAFVVTLALGWQQIRRAFLSLLPAGLAARLPNAATGANADRMGG